MAGEGTGPRSKMMPQHSEWQTNTQRAADTAAGGREASAVLGAQIRGAVCGDREAGQGLCRKAGLRRWRARTCRQGMNLNRKVLVRVSG